MKRSELAIKLREQVTAGEAVADELDSVSERAAYDALQPQLHSWYGETRSVVLAIGGQPAALRFNAAGSPRQVWGDDWEDSLASSRERMPARLAFLRELLRSQDSWELPPDPPTRGRRAARWLTAPVVDGLRQGVVRLVSTGLVSGFGLLVWFFWRQ